MFAGDFKMVALNKPSALSGRSAYFLACDLKLGGLGVLAGGSLQLNLNHSSHSRCPMRSRKPRDFANSKR